MGKKFVGKNRDVFFFAKLTPFKRMFIYNMKKVVP